MAIKVLVVDDSAVVRQTLQKVLSSASDIEVVGTAPDPYVARDKIIETKPDVVTLDIEMPRMDGLSFLRKLMKHYPTPVIIVSSIATEGSQVALEALQSGAVEVVAKPGAAYTIGEMGHELIEKVRSASVCNLKLLVKQLQSNPEPTRATTALSRTTNKIVAIGASTGGTQAIEAIVRSYPANAPGTVVVQHMPPGFTRSFAERLDSLSAVTVREAQGGEVVGPGYVYVAPGNKHVLMKRDGANYCIAVKDGPLVEGHRPSVDVLFRSVAKFVGANAVGVMLTGMGKDGADAMLELRNSGARTIAQDEASCVVFGMPKVAIEVGAVETVLPLNQIAERAIALTQK